MANLETTYLGLTLRNPFIVGASGYTANLDRIRQLEEAGAGALVTASLFEEQIQYERFRLEEQLERFDNLSPEMSDIFPNLKHAGSKEHLMWVRRTKETAHIPVIASLNAVSRDTWVQYSRELEQAGADALELNFYATPSDPQVSGSQVEREQVATLRAVRRKVKIPISVKLSFFYTNPLAFVKALDEEGVNGFVLFNRLFQPDIDIDSEKNRYTHTLSAESDHLVAMRFAGLLAGSLRADICAGCGILSARDAVKMILAGAACMQVVSALYRNKIAYLGTMIQELGSWMDDKGYRDLASFRGRMAAGKNPDPSFYRRAQYVKHLLKADYGD
jgi:dihydroorotate dehydrogenase (fumarate)